VTFQSWLAGVWFDQFGYDTARDRLRTSVPGHTIRAIPGGGNRADLACAGAVSSALFGYELGVVASGGTVIRTPDPATSPRAGLATRHPIVMSARYRQSSGSSA
jgi:hypothetical protein